MEKAAGRTAQKRQRVEFRSFPQPESEATGALVAGMSAERTAVALKGPAAFTSLPAGQRPPMAPDGGKVPAQYKPERTSIGSRMANGGLWPATR